MINGSIQLSLILCYAASLTFVRAAVEVVTAMSERKHSFTE